MRRDDANFHTLHRFVTNCGWVCWIVEAPMIGTSYIGWRCISPYFDGVSVDRAIMKDRKVTITATCRDCGEPATVITPYGVRCTKHGFEIFFERDEDWSLLLIHRRDRVRRAQEPETLEPGRTR